MTSRRPHAVRVDQLVISGWAVIRPERMTSGAMRSNTRARCACVLVLEAKMVLSHRSALLWTHSQFGLALLFFCAEYWSARRFANGRYGGENVVQSVLLSSESVGMIENERLLQ
jgi:hypothetical protein